MAHVQFFQRKCVYNLQKAIYSANSWQLSIINSVGFFLGGSGETKCLNPIQVVVLIFPICALQDNSLDVWDPIIFANLSISTSPRTGSLFNFPTHGMDVAQTKIECSAAPSSVGPTSVAQGLLPPNAVC